MKLEELRKVIVSFEETMFRENPRGDYGPISPGMEGDPEHYVFIEDGKIFVDAQYCTNELETFLDELENRGLIKCFRYDDEEEGYWIEL